MKRGLFITGTDTGIGKTLVSALLLSALQQSLNPHGTEPGYFKPIQTGEDDDTREVLSLVSPSSSRRIQIIDPIYRFKAPQAPYRAAALENAVIETQRICRRWSEIPDGTWVVEGAGGLLVPLSTRTTVRELIGDLGIPALVVASTRLGTINHTLLTLESAQRYGIRVAGVVLVGQSDPGLAETIQGFTSVPVFAEVPQLARVDSPAIEELARKLFPLEVIDALFTGPLV